MAVLKRLKAPGFWPIEKKAKTYTVAMQPGPHRRTQSLTLTVVLRDILHHAETFREARQILLTRTVRVNGSVRVATGFPVGVMDVVSIGNESHRVLPDKHGLKLVRLSDKEAGFTLKKITGRTSARGGKVQLQFHDGTTILSDQACKSGDVALFDLAGKRITGVIRQEKGTQVIITEGNNRGAIGRLKDVTIVKSPEPNIATVDVEGKTITLPLGYVFAVGSPEPAISLGERHE